MTIDMTPANHGGSWGSTAQAGDAPPPSPAAPYGNPWPWAPTRSDAQPADGVPQHARPASHRALGPIFLGALAATALLGVYLGGLSWAQGWSHARQQLVQDPWFVGLITAGFATQVGLLAYLRRGRCRVSATGVAAGGGASAVAMLACCAHHAVDVLAVIGLSGVLALLQSYRMPLLALGAALNLGGALYLATAVRGRSQAGVQ